ncbi:CHAT domain-containing protein [Streptomyces sp. NPDC004732]|uniref:CHAT domain-containing protein n=1 Tax=Streptomyces sp. NPDC004732 TaxID=3154290 RepID=UPI00339FA302
MTSEHLRELRAEREALLDALAALSASDPRAPALCATAGELSRLLYLEERRPEDLERGAEAFGLAFEAPGDTGEWAVWRIQYGHVRSLQYEVDPDPEHLVATSELLQEGLGALPVDGTDAEAYDGVRKLAVLLLAICAKLRCLEAREDVQGPERVELIDEALLRHEQAAALLDPGTQDAVDLREAQGYLFLERGALHGGPADSEAAVGHYRAVLDAGLSTSDLPFVRHSMATALMRHALATADWAELEEARDELGIALREARQRTGEKVRWVREAEVAITFIRVVIWGDRKDKAQAAVAEVELRALLDDPETVRLLTPHHLSGFGRLLYERASVRGDPAGRDRGIALLRRAVTEWRPERDGKVTAAACGLAIFQWARHLDDPDPQRFRDMAEAAELILADDRLDDQTRRMGLTLAAMAWLGQEEQEPGSGGEMPGTRLDELLAMRDALLDDLEEGRAFLDFSEVDDDFPGLSLDITGARQRAALFEREYARWQEREDGDGRAGVALELLGRVVMMDPHGDLVTQEQKEALIACVLGARDQDADWQRRAHAVVGHVRLRDAMAGTGNRLDEVLDHFELAGGGPARGADGALAGGADQGHVVDLARVMATRQRGQTGGARDDVEAAGGAWRQLREDPRVTPHQRGLMDAVQAAHDAHAALLRGDLAAGDRCIAVVLDTHAGLHPDDPSRLELWTHLENVRMVRDELARTLGAPAAPPLTGRPSVSQLRSAAARLPRDHRVWVLGDGGLSRFVRAGHTRDMPALAEAMELVQEAHDLADEGSENRLRYAGCLGVGHTALAEVQRDPAARARHLDRAVGLLETAFRAVAGPEHRLYASTGLALARAYRSRGDRRHDDRTAARRTGLDALRGHAWAALLQSGTDQAAQAAIEATAGAREVAAWCLRDNAPDEAVRALDACRGLVLHAATTSRTVPERLAAAGRGDLADEWRAAGARPEPATDPFTAAQAPLTVPSALRRRVLAALAGVEEAQDRLLDPPTVEEVAGALRTLRKDALVYLVPASDGVGGTAVVITSGGEVHAVPMPRLTEDAAPLRDYRSEPGAARDRVPVPGDDRDLGPVPPADGHGGSRTSSPREQVDRLCGWAWYAGVKPLFDAFAAPAGPGRIPRLVLVPMGTLGLVPWHAAWCPGADGRRRYALREAEISYAASARLLCDVAARPPVTLGGAALVVGDPTGDLHYAGEEADAVQRVFYPHGRFLGRRAGGADGPGTPQEVVDWLAAGAREDAGGDGGVLHLACHAAVAKGGRSSAYLSLHGGELSAEDLTEAVGGGRGGRLGLVLLAACRSHVSGRGYNEAYSLATAFLVAGARSVIGSLWPVPDDATSVLMFLTHYFLRAEGLPPAKALRRAQLCMLDPARDLPADLPAPLAGRARRIDPDDLVAWAGFTHLGQ